MDFLRDLELIANGKVGPYSISDTARAANAEIARLRAALEDIAYHYANQDMSHADFRIHAGRVADKALRSPNGQ